MEIENIPNKPDYRGTGPVDDQDWLMAQERVLLYLRTMKVPPLRALYLAKEALERAMYDSVQSADMPPTAKTMRALRDFVNPKYDCTPFCEFCKPCNARRSGQNVRTEKNFNECAGNALVIGATPPLNKGVMVPEEIILNPWRMYYRQSMSQVRNSLTETLNTQMHNALILLVLAVLILFVSF